MLIEVGPGYRNVAHWAKYDIIGPSIAYGKPEKCTLICVEK